MLICYGSATTAFWIRNRKYSEYGSGFKKIGKSPINIIFKLQESISQPYMFFHPTED